MKIHFEYGDLVIYASGSEPRIGRYVRNEDGKMLIVPEGNGAILVRDPSKVIKLAYIYKKYEEKIKRQTWSLQ